MSIVNVDGHGHGHGVRGRRCSHERVEIKLGLVLRCRVNGEPELEQWARRPESETEERC
jgi:hypothetical protein